MSSANKGARGVLGALGLGALIIAAGFAVGVGLGILSGALWVWGFFAMIAGIGLGAVSTFADTLFVGRPTRTGAVAVILGTLLAWGAWQGFEDAHQQRAFAVDLARSRAADSGFPAEEMARAFDEDQEATIAFLAKDAEAVFAEQVHATTGFDGVLGRFIARHDAGLRLASAGRKIFGLSVRAPLSIAASLAELLLAIWIAMKIRRVARRVASA